MVAHLASITTLVEGHSQWALLLMFGLLTLESFGLPLPGETAVVACAVLASQGVLPIEAVIVVAIAAAIIGDNLGYWTARKGGRRLLYRWEWSGRYADHYLPRGERFFHRHGGKTVFLGRFVAVLRFTAAWTAGLAHMGPWRFLAWNAAGGITWATLVSLVAYYLGDAAVHAVSRYGFLAAVAAVVLGGGGLLIVRRLEDRVVDEAEGD